MASGASASLLGAAVSALGSRAVDRRTPSVRRRGVGACRDRPCGVPASAQRPDLPRRRRSAALRAAHAPDAPGHGPRRPAPGDLWRASRDGLVRALRAQRTNGGSGRRCGARGVGVPHSPMACARLVGDRVIRRSGPVTSVQLSAGCAPLPGQSELSSHPTSRPRDRELRDVSAEAGRGTRQRPIVFTTAGRVGPHAGRSIAGVAGVATPAASPPQESIGGIAAAFRWPRRVLPRRRPRRSHGLGASVLRTRDEELNGDER